MPSNELLESVSTAALEPAGRADHPRALCDGDLLTPKEYAKMRRCSERTLDRERAEGRGCPYVRLGARILYRRRDIERYVEAHIRGDFREMNAAGEPPPRRRGRPPKASASKRAT